MTFLGVALEALACSMCLEGCDDARDTTPGAIPSGPVPYGELPQALARAVCENSAHCCASQGKPFNESHCESGLTEAYASGLGNLGPAAAYDTNGSEECITAYTEQARYCGMLSAGPPCTISFGTETSTYGQLGGPCGMTCKSAGDTLYCTSDGAMGPLPDGGSQTLSPLICYSGRGLYCDHGTCAAQVSQGEACTSDEQCEDGFFCQNGTCADLFGDGADCASDRLACADGFHCDASTHTCVGQRPQAGACDNALDCVSGSCDHGTCVIEPDFYSLVCTP